MSRNSTLEDGSPGGFRACLRWYDWSRFAARTDCTANVADLQQTPVAPNWMQQDAEYLGTGVEHGVAVHIWDRREGPDGDAHVYKVAQSDGRPIQMLTTGPDLGRGREVNQKDYINYIEEEIDPTVFDVPPACADGRAQVVDWTEMLANPDVMLGL